MTDDDVIADESDVFNLAVSIHICRFPRLRDKYKFIIRGGPTVDIATKNADFVFNSKIFLNSLDKVLSVSKVANFFEVTIHYLHSKYEKELTEHERLRLSGSKSKVFIADFAENSFDAAYSTLCKRDYYSISFCKHPSKLDELILNELPELLVVNDKSRTFEGTGILKYIRNKGFNNPAVVYGDLSYSEASKKYLQINNVLYFLHIPLENQLLEYVELALNDIKPKKYSSYYIK